MDYDKLAKDVINEMDAKIEDFHPYRSDPAEATLIKKAIVQISAEVCKTMLEKLHAENKGI